MSGGSVPYHLRQNKTVERGVFLDLLLRVARSTPTKLRDYRYIGFAGPFSEDFKLIHSQLGISHFVSIEMDEAVLKRQRWNAPVRGIEYRHLKSREYIDEHDSAIPSIVWLDYTEPKTIGHQLSELESLVSKSADYDLIKVTFNASNVALGHDPTIPLNTIPLRIARARERLGNFLPVGFDVTPEDVDRKGYPCLILKAVEYAVKRGMEGKTLSRFQPLAAFIYQDSEHRMLTLTGIVLPKKEVTSFLKDTGLKTWRLATTKWAK